MKKPARTMKSTLALVEEVNVHVGDLRMNFRRYTKVGKAKDKLFQVRFIMEQDGVETYPTVVIQRVPTSEATSKGEWRMKAFEWDEGGGRKVSLKHWLDEPELVSKRWKTPEKAFIEFANWLQDMGHLPSTSSLLEYVHG